MKTLRRRLELFKMLFNEPKICLGCAKLYLKDCGCTHNLYTSYDTVFTSIWALRAYLIPTIVFGGEDE